MEEGPIEAPHLRYVHIRPSDKQAHTHGTMEALLSTSERSEGYTSVPTHQPQGGDSTEIFAELRPIVARFQPAAPESQAADPQLPTVRTEEHLSNVLRERDLQLSLRASVHLEGPHNGLRKVCYTVHGEGSILLY
jgi:hypothetical protein